MPAFPAAFRPRDKQEPKALVVAISVLQLGFVILVWLLALLPVALMALTATVIQALRPATAKAPTTPVDS